MPANPEASYFKDGEDVLAYHGPLIHAASISKSENKDAPDGRGKLRIYMIHYSGWSDHWDEWVPESRLLKKNDDHLALQKERIKDFQKAHKKSQKRKADGEAQGDKGGAAGAKKTKAVENSSEETLAAELRESLRLPHGMKLKLIEDWERITRERKLVPMPCEYTVNAILDDFQSQKARRSSHERLYGEVCDGVRSYFNHALPTLLLYKYEMRQYRELKQRDKLAPSEMYGAEHLLRLFVKLPELLAKCNMQREHITVLVAKLTELIKFIQTQKSKFFVADYEAPTEEYIKSHLDGN